MPSSAQAREIDWICFLYANRISTRCASFRAQSPGPPMPLLRFAGTPYRLLRKPRGGSTGTRHSVTRSKINDLEPPTTSLSPVHGTQNPASLAGHVNLTPTFSIRNEWLIGSKRGDDQARTGM